MDFSDDDVEKCKERLGLAVDEKRFVHSLSVGEMLCELMPALDRNVAFVLGLSHDYTHKYSMEDNLKLIDGNSLALYDGERELAPCLHAVTGAWYFRQFFPKADESYVYALRHHTILVKGADELTLNLYTADKIERTREYMQDDMSDKIISLEDAETRALVVMEDQQRFLEAKGKSLLACTLAYMQDIRKRKSVLF